MAHPVVQM